MGAKIAEIVEYLVMIITLKYEDRLFFIRLG